jgi:hypothetical protein
VLGSIPPEAKVQPATSVTGDVAAILSTLGEEGVVQLLVEGGATVAHDLHARVSSTGTCCTWPPLFGGDDARPALAGPGVRHLGPVAPNCLDPHAGRRFSASTCCLESPHWPNRHENWASCARPEEG